jgi:hypothetical protein
MPQAPFGQRLSRKVGRMRALADYRLRQVRHRDALPPIGSVGKRILHDLAFDGVSAVRLEDLNFAANAAFWKAAQAAVEELRPMTLADASDIEYNSGFDHCVPLNPSRIASAYPALYTWGLDEGLLDIVENHIGTPIAYHGVIVRKEILDGDQVGTRGWHMDGEDHDITRVSVYLTDVNEPDAGAFEYIPASISPSHRQLGAGFINDDRMREVVPQWQWKACTGAAGTVLFTSVAHIFHRGRIPNTERVAASFYYTSRHPTNPDLCREYSFAPGMPSLNVTLTPRQLDCLWEYRALLPNPQVA